MVIKPTGLAHDPTGTALGNIVGDGSGGTLDPELSELGDYGGSTQTHALLPSSPAIDAGNTQLAIGLASDQRAGQSARFRGDSIDIGAYEAEVRQGLDGSSVDSLFVLGSTGDR